MEGDRIGTGGNISDVSISFLEPPEKHLQVQSAADDGDEEEELATPKETSDSDDPITNPLEIEALRSERLDLQRRLASSAADFEGELSRLQHALILKSSEADNALAEADVTKKVLEEQKKDLEDRVRYLEGRLSDLKVEKESEAANFLKKEGEFRLVVEELNFKAEKSRIALVNKEDEVNSLTEALNKCKEEAEAEKEKISYSVAKEKEAVISLEEKLIVMREKVEELIAERQKAKLAMEEKEVVIASLTEALRIEREKERDILEIEKKFGAAMTKKEDEIASLKKELMLTKENHESENNMLEDELKLLKGDVSDLEERIEKLLSGNEDGFILQNNRRMEPKIVEDGLRVSWVTAAAIIASIGTVTATITAFCLRHNKHE